MRPSSRVTTKDTAIFVTKLRIAFIFLSSSKLNDLAAFRRNSIIESAMDTLITVTTQIWIDLIHFVYVTIHFRNWNLKNANGFSHPIFI